MTRLESNLEILRRLETYLKTWPDMRFGQALINLDILTYTDIVSEQNDGTAVLHSVIEDPFYEEPAAMLKRMNEK